MSLSFATLNRDKVQVDILYYSVKQDQAAANPVTVIHVMAESDQHCTRPSGSLQSLEVQDQTSPWIRAIVE